MATKSNDTSSVPQKAADAVFVPTQEHGFNNKVQGNMISWNVITHLSLCAVHSILITSSQSFFFYIANTITGLDMYMWH